MDLSPPSLESGAVSLLQHDNEAIRKEIALLKRKLANYESDQVDASRFSEKDALGILSLFHNKSSKNSSANALSPTDFSHMVVALGQDISDVHVGLAFGLLDADSDGLISLTEFFLWISRQHPSIPTGRSPASSKGKEGLDLGDDVGLMGDGGGEATTALHGTEELRVVLRHLEVMRMKLTSPYYMCMVKRLLAKMVDAQRDEAVIAPTAASEARTHRLVHSFSRPGWSMFARGGGARHAWGRPATPGFPRTSCGDGLVRDGALIHVHGSLMVGSFDRSACRASLCVRKSQAEAEAARKENHLPPYASMLSLVFTAAKGVGAFELGEVSGSIQDVLLVAKDEIQCDGCKVEVIHDVPTTTAGEDEECAGHGDGSPPPPPLGLSISLYFYHNTDVELAREFVASAKFERLLATLELSHSPGDPDDEFIAARAHGYAYVQRSGVEFLQGYLGDGEGGYPSSESDVLSLLMALRTMRVHMRFDSMQAMYERVFYDSMLSQMKGWASARAMLTPMLAQAMKHKDVPESAPETYALVKDCLVALHSASIVLGDTMADVHFENVRLVEFMPTEEELGLDQW